MRLLRDKLKSSLNKVRAGAVDDDKRRDLIFVWFNVLFCIVAAFMTVVNIFTQKWLLFSSTLTFSLLCLFNYWLFYRGARWRKVSFLLFLAETVVLCGFFCISGTPEGFSALWTCFIPSFSFSLLGMKKGSCYSGIGFVMVALIFWTPLGRECLHYDYTQSFMLRFPMIYLAFTLLAMFLEFIRAETQRQLKEAEHLYHHLYRRDALTGILNRYGFNERLDALFADPEAKTLTLMILDLDYFKQVNDDYGHNAGDVVLRFIASTLTRMAGENAAVCRWGGEEFTVLTANAPDPQALAEDIRREIESSVIRAGDAQIRVTVTVGVCSVNGREGFTIAQLVRSADLNLYRGKDAGRNRVCATWLGTP